MKWIPVVTKVYRFLASKGRSAEVEEVRRWFQPLIPPLSEKIDELLSLRELNELVENALPEGKWQPAVALAQTLMLIDVSQPLEEIKTRIELLLNVWNENPVNYSALLSELRKRVIALGGTDRSIVETLSFDSNKPSYFSSEYSESGVDFFLNYLRFEEGVDVDELVASLRKLVEREETVEDLLRLSGIDLLLKPEEFVERVGKAVDVLLKAKEQGLSVEKIVERWDELANQGGDRFSYLEAAVKDVAAREINEAFWREMEKVLSSVGTNVIVLDHHKDPSVVTSLLSLGLLKIVPGGVEFTDELREVVRNIWEVLQKVEPSPIHSIGDLNSLMRRLVLEGSASGKEVIFRSRVFRDLSPSTLRVMLAEKGYVETTVEALKKTVLRGFSVDKFVEAVERAVQERPTAKTFFNTLMENVHREEGM